MSSSKCHRISVAEIEPEKTSHGTSQKWVLRTCLELKNSLTQIAFGRFEIGESCPEHKHTTMDEYFFFTQGKGTYIIGDDQISIEPNTLIEVPANTTHLLVADKGEALEFVYWGVATD